MINIHTIDFEFYENKVVLPMNRTMGNVMTGNNFFFFTESSKTFFTVVLLYKFHGNVYSCWRY